MVSVGRGESTQARLAGGWVFAKGERGVRVELEVADDRVLLSDFDLWHYVLNYWYLPESEKDGKAFEKKLARAGLSFYGCDHQHPLAARPIPPRDRAELGADIRHNWADRGQAIASPPKKKSIQATLWELFA